MRRDINDLWGRHSTTILKVETVVLILFFFIMCGTKYCQAMEISDKINKINTDNIVYKDNFEVLFDDFSQINTLDESIDSSFKKNTELFDDDISAKIKAYKEAKAAEEAAKRAAANHYYSYSGSGSYTGSGSSSRPSGGGSSYSVPSGAYGRLVIHGTNINVPLYAGSITSNTQWIVDRSNSAAYLTGAGITPLIGDHNYQGFSTLINLRVGSRATIYYANGSSRSLTMTGKVFGHNYSGDMKDSNGNSVLWQNAGGINMYTCTDGNHNVVVTYWR